jgi:asparagine synthase (glutamine-hydrolysing)
MCGLAGVAFSDPDRVPGADLLRAMGDAVAHRGPDDAGEKTGPGYGLASRRLAIVDLSPLGRMPMASEDGATVLAFNGEIYNHVELREDLKRRGVRFRSGTDTEVLLRLYLAEGLEGLRRVIGMFGFALWDGRRGRMILARDRLGVKPMLYRVAPDGLRFASEMPALLAEPGYAPVPDPVAIHHLLALRHVPCPGTAYDGILQLPPAHLLIWERGRARVERWWSIPAAQAGEAADRGRAGGAGNLEDRFLALMDDAVRLRLRSDVPVALLLSGGLDSAAVAWHIRRCHAAGFRAFTIGFAEADYDERPAAREVARRFGIDLEEIVLPACRLDDLEALVGHLGIPFADPSALSCWILARAVGRQVKVALTGDGGDEMFGGYDRYRAHRLADRFGWLPGIVSRTPFHALLEAAAGERGRRNLPGRLRRFLEGWEMPARERNALWMANPGARRIARLYRPEFAARVAAIDPTRALGSIPNDFGGAATLERILRADQEHYLPDDLLFKADITSMAFGLELRSPFLDHRVVEFAARLPAGRKVGLRTGKIFLRRLYRGRIPAAVLRRRKAGFGLPIDHWFRGDLHAAAADLLLGPAARSRDYLNRDAVAAVLKVHRSGQRNYDEMIWTLLVLELWLRRRPGAGARAAA